MNDLLNQPQAWGVILGVIAPLLISVVQRPGMTGTVRSVVAIAASLVIGVVTVLSTGDFNPENVLTTFAAVLAASHLAFESFYKPTGLAKVVELKTSRAVEPYQGKHERERDEDLAA